VLKLKTNASSFNTMTEKLHNGCNSEALLKALKWCCYP